MKTENPCVGGVVKATAGRDKGKYFVIVELLGAGYVYLADGKSRRLASPKKKNLKHLKFLDKVVFGQSELAKANDAALRKALKPFYLKEQGG